MRGQSHTVMMYLVWGVFFVAALVLIHYIFSNTVQSSTPSPLPAIMDTIRSAINAGETGIEGETCIEVYPAGEISITEDLIERHTGYTGRINFVCEATGSCEEGRDYMTIYGRRGLLCASYDGRTLEIVWR